MSLTGYLCGSLRIFEKLLENKHMNDTNDDTNMTGNADNRSILRTKCGQGFNQGEQASETELSRLSKWNEELLRLTLRNEELTEQRDGAREELAATRKDYMCLAERLDGHDATECRVNLDRLIETNRQLVTACKQLMQVIGSPDDPPGECWATDDEINDAWYAGAKALEAVKGGAKC